MLRLTASPVRSPTSPLLSLQSLLAMSVTWLESVGTPMLPAHLPELRRAASRRATR